MSTYAYAPVSMYKCVAVVVVGECACGWVDVFMYVSVWVLASVCACVCNRENNCTLRARDRYTLANC